MIGLELADVTVEGCITKAPCRGEMAGRSSVDRGKQGLKRSTVVDASGIPLGTVAAPANRHDTPLLEPTLDTITVHLDRGNNLSSHLGHLLGWRRCFTGLDRFYLLYICLLSKGSIYHLFTDVIISEEKGDYWRFLSRTSPSMIRCRNS